MSQAENSTGRIVFDAVEIDLDGQRLFVAGKAVPLEPKAFAVLVLLAQQPGQAFDRDAILDAVWSHRHVTPGVLTRVMMLIRQALQERPPEHRYVHTLHGIGYRFDAQTQRLPGVSASEAQPRPDAGTSHAAMEKKLQARRPHPFGAAFAGSRMRTGAAIGLILVLLAVACVGFIGRPKTVGLEPPTLAVAPFLAKADNSSLQDLAESYGESLIDAFASNPSWRVLGRDSTFAVARGTNNPATVAEQLDADYVLYGEIETKEAMLTVTASLWQRSRRTIIWSHTDRVDRAKLFTLMPATVDRVTGNITAVKSSNATALTASALAEDLYWLGRHYWQQRTPASLTNALAHFQNAVREDPGFARAYVGIADSYLLLYEYANLSQEEALSNARIALDRAHSLQPELTEISASEGLFQFEQDHYRGAVETFSRTVDALPNNPQFMLWYGNALAIVGRVREAGQWHEKALKLDPLSAALQDALGIDDMLAGEELHASERFRRAIELNPDFLEPYWQMAGLQLLHGRLAAAMLAYAQSSRPAAVDASAIRTAYAWLQFGDAAAALRRVDDASSASRIERLDVTTLALAMSGRAPQALTLVRAFSPQSSEINEYTSVLARTLALAGDRKSALETYEHLRQLDSDYLCTQLWTWFPSLIREHRANYIALLKDQGGEYLPALNAYRAQVEALAENGFALPVLHYQRALVAALAGDIESARNHLKRALDEGWLDAFALQRDLAWRPLRDEAWLEAAQRRIDERIAAERVLLANNAALDKAKF